MLLTICTKNRKRILVCDEMHDLLRSAWDVHDDYPVGRYVIMPEHIHLFTGENDVSFVALPNWVAKWKGYVTSRWQRSGDRPIWQEVSGIDNFWVQLRMSQSGFMFGGTPSVTVWSCIRTTGRIREKRCVCRGNEHPRGVASFRPQRAATSHRRRTAPELRRGMRRPSDRVVDRLGMDCNAEYNARMGHGARWCRERRMS
jgi:hypothetical protein